MFRTRRTIGAPAGFTGGSAGRFRSTVRRSSSLSPGSRRRSRFFDDLRRGRVFGRGRDGIQGPPSVFRAPTSAASAARAAAAGAAAVLTTEKDYVRLLPHRPFPMPVGWVPLTMEPDPLAEFRHWLAGAVARRAT